jgi:hypothetical protein
MTKNEAHKILEENEEIQEMAVTACRRAMIDALTDELHRVFEVWIDDDSDIVTTNGKTVPCGVLLARFDGAGWDTEEEIYASISADDFGIADILEGLEG